ncbi:putative uncharacterized protein [Bacteroides sp. CAG:598]|nr:putative uncharacterized protein [Bacteroides sp. CAG:598]
MGNTGKRMYRNLRDDTKAKISQSLKGRSKSASHIQAISQGMLNYWKTIPIKADDNPSDKTEKEGQ